MIQNDNSNEPIEFQLSANRSILYIFFGGISAGIGIPMFEFQNSSKIIDENKIFVRDFSQSWYQGGLPNISEDLYSTAEYLKKKIEEISPEKIFFVGNSMGGFAAILFATLIGKGEVIAFAPQTFISPALRLKHKDDRWKSQLLNTYKLRLSKKQIWDLKPLLARSDLKLKISIFVAKNNRLDLIHASHLEDIAGVRVHAFDEGGHAVVKLLRDNGILNEIMTGNYVE